ncbi:helix-turn-helix domain-containing protein [Nocardia asiatica]|uniref:helix-turn-helix domain-containing protein n=1 Tax=Nocardia asiatica TaxID=209252 RepID=UPI002455E392|nr:helix-turn-helix domain-containing protein [Nocardia asiatica]
MSMPNPLDLITFRAAGDLLGVSHPSIRRWISEGKLSEYRIANSPRVDRHEVLSLVVRVSAAQEATR